MVKACLPSIRQSTATLINSYPESLDITVQGHHRCVDLAKHHIDMILQDFKSSSNSNSSERHNQFERNVTPIPSQSTAFEANSASYSNSNCDIQNNSDHLSERSTEQKANDVVTSSPAKLDDNVFFSGDSNSHYEELYNFSPLSRLIQEKDDTPKHYRPDPVTTNTQPLQAYKKPYQQIAQAFCSGGPTNQDDIMTDDRFSNRINQAIKLGYSEEQVQRVLKKLGVNSSMEDMMRELVSEPQDLEQELDTALSEELHSNDTNLFDSDDSEGFDVNDSSNLRQIIIDGSNVAMSHGQKVFSCLGIKIVVDWFKSRGHKNITAFVPQWRKETSRPDAPITNQEILTELEEERIVVFTPSRRVGGTRIVCYDDRFVLQRAVQVDGIIVSNDVYRDLVRESDDFKQVVEKRLLMYSFVQDTFMPPEDPLGRQGPSLDNFLRIKPSEPKNKPQICPYGKKCTYGNKCRFFHPERRYSSQKMVAEKLKESAKLKLKAAKADKSEALSDQGRKPKQKLSRTLSLIPQDASDVTKSDVTPSEDVKKPVLNHSKSMVYPNSYLANLRLKMEEAELAETFQQSLSTTTPSPHQEMNPDEMHSAAKDANLSQRQHSSSCNPSPRISPTPQAEVVAKVKVVRSFPSSPIPSVPPSFTVNSVKSSLNIPNNLEPQDRYLSGHLLVVKRLSDEDNNNGKFFSQHTARAAGLSPQGNQTLGFDGNNIHSNDSSKRPVAHATPFQQPVESSESNLWNTKEIYEPEISSQVGYNEKAVRSSKPISPTIPFSPKEREHNPSVTSSTLVNQSSEQYVSCPPFSQSDEVSDLPQCPQFERSLSVSTASHSAESVVQPPSHALRKYSWNTIATNNIEDSFHTNVKARSSLPLDQRTPYSQYNTNATPFQPQLYRHRMSVDSGISSGGLSSDQSFLNSPFSPLENLSSPFSYSSNLSSPVPFSQITNNNNSSFRPMMHQQEPTMHNSGMGGGLSSSPAHLQYSPFPHRIQPFFQDKSQVQNTVSLTRLPFQTSTTHSPIYRPPPPNSMMNQYMSCPPPNQPQPQPAYPQPMMNLQSSYYPMSFQGSCDSPLPYSPSTPMSPFLQQQQPFLQQQSKVIDEEAPISVDDPRYSVYYNLSSVYGERAVRTFMNRNPDVRNFNELYSLIASYKQDTGV